MKRLYNLESEKSQTKFSDCLLDFQIASKHHDQFHSRQLSQQLYNSDKKLQNRNIQVQQNNSSSGISDQTYKTILQQNPFSFSYFTYHEKTLKILKSMCVLIMSQDRIIQQLIQKSILQQGLVNKIQQKISQKVSHCYKIGNEKFEKRQKIVSKNNLPANCLMSGDGLINYLFGNRVFKYYLVVDFTIPFELPLYKDKNFKLFIKLIDNKGKLYPNDIKIPLILSLYTVESQPKLLDCNQRGNKILKGVTQQELYEGTCRFQKLHINSVTSHFQGGMLFLVAMPKYPKLSLSGKRCDDYNQIRPLVIQKIVVKAKEIKQTLYNQNRMGTKEDIQS